MTALPVPRAGDEVAWVRQHLGDLVVEAPEDVAASPTRRGGQAAADAALDAFDVAGYGADRNEVLPRERRGASGLSPYIRHGLLTLPRVWRHVEGGPVRDVAKFHDELLWQEYSRHLYARLGSALGAPLRYAPRRPTDPTDSTRDPERGPWNRSMACVDEALSELDRDGWLVNQARMWLASDWTVRHGWDWRAGEDYFFTHLLDGSRAANRLGWQWTVGTGTGRPYGFSRRQVVRRAPELCGGCPLRDACPIEDWPDASEPEQLPPMPLLRSDPDPATTAGPAEPVQRGDPEAVWLTGESLGEDDPALRAHPELPAVFVFDEPLLSRLRLSSKRLAFITQTLAELAGHRTVQVHRGDPTRVLEGWALATTFAPVPGWRRRASRLAPVALHPFPWLRRPDAGPVASFSAWRRHLRG